MSDKQKLIDGLNGDLNRELEATEEMRAVELAADSLSVKSILPRISAKSELTQE